MVGWTWCSVVEKGSSGGILMVVVFGMSVVAALIIIGVEMMVMVQYLERHFFHGSCVGNIILIKHYHHEACQFT